MKKLILIFGIIALLISFVFLKIDILDFPTDIIRAITNNITSNFNSLSSDINEKISAFYNISQIIDDNKRLANENQNLIQKINEITEKNVENNIINSSIDFVKDYNYKFAKILTINKGITNTVTINIGSNDGVKVGYPVVFKNGFLIGKIKQVENNSSIVLLTIDKASEVAATISGYDHSIGIINGNYGLNFEFNYVSSKENIAINDIVVTSGIESNVPSGLIIGKVSLVEHDPTDFSQTISVAPIIPFENFRIVSVILPNHN